MHLPLTIINLIKPRPVKPVVSSTVCNTSLLKNDKFLLMKKILTSVLALMLVAGAVQAQDKQEGGKRHHRGGREMVAKQLNLTEDQKTKFKSINEAERKEMQAIKSTGSLTQDQAKAQRKQLHEKYKAQRESILTADQKAKLATLKKEGKQKGMGDRKMKMEKLGKELNITEAQKSKLTAIQSDFKTKREAIKNNNSLTQEQKKEQFKSLAKEHKEQAKAVLTQEQIQKMQELRKDHKRRITK